MPGRPSILLRPGGLLDQAGHDGDPAAQQGDRPVIPVPEQIAVPVAHGLEKRRQGPDAEPEAEHPGLDLRLELVGDPEVLVRREHDPGSPFLVVLDVDLSLCGRLDGDARKRHEVVGIDVRELTVGKDRRLHCADPPKIDQRDSPALRQQMSRLRARLELGAIPSKHLRRLGDDTVRLDHRTAGSGDEPRLFGAFHILGPAGVLLPPPRLHQDCFLRVHPPEQGPGGTQPWIRDRSCHPGAA